MDPSIVKYLTEKGLLQPTNMSVNDPSQAMSVGQPPSPLTPAPMSVQPPAPPPVPSTTAPSLPPVEDDDGSLTPEQMARYGIRTPDQIKDAKDKRTKMGDDLAKQSDMNTYAKLLAGAADNISATGNRIIAGNVQNSAPGIGAALDANLKGQKEKVEALDDQNKIGDNDYNRLKDLDNNRLKLQELRDVAADRNAALAMRQKEINAYKDANIGARNERFRTEQDRKDDDQLAKFSKALNGVSASSRSALGRSALTVQGARSVIGLAGDDPKQYDKLNPQQVYEIAKSYDRVVSNGNPTISGTSHLIPPAALTSLANFNQYMSSNVTGANQGEIVNQMVQGAKREAAISQNLQKHMVDTLLPAYSNLRKRRADDMDQIVTGVNNVQTEDPTKVLQGAGIQGFGQQGPPPATGLPPAGDIAAEMKRRGF
jgi:hypothetical protein